MLFLLSGIITPADQQRAPYHYLPFDLPFAAERIEIDYRYSDPIASDQTEGGNVIDIGLFDPRGAAFPGGAGFRGWSGSRRAGFYIARDSATPGYLPGPLPPGRYLVILGLYRIAPGGASYEVRIHAHTPAAAALSGAHTPHPRTRASGAHAAPARWLRGDLQSHTEHSDADGSVAQLVAKARALELDFLAITDHNTVSHHAEFDTLRDEAPLIIPAQECTTYRGHMNIWGEAGWCDFRCTTDDDMRAVIELARRHGALCSINHPKRGGPAWEYSADLPVDAIEVWQGPWPWRNTESLALWEQLLAGGKRVTAVGGSDYHCPAGEERGFLRLGQPTTWIYARERSVTALLESIRAGCVTIGAAPDGPRIDMHATSGAYTARIGEALPAGTTIELTLTVERGAGLSLHLIADGAICAMAPVRSEHEVLQMTIAARRFVRAELVGDCPPALLPANAPVGIDVHNWRWALTNPVYIDA